MISMLIVFAQLFQNAIYYNLLERGRLKARLAKNRIVYINAEPIGTNVSEVNLFNQKANGKTSQTSSAASKEVQPMSSSSKNQRRLKKKRKEFLHFLTKVQVEKSCHEYTAMRFNSFSRVAFCVALILFLIIYWPYVVKKGYIFNLEN